MIANRCLRPYTSLAQIRNVVIRTPSDNSLKFQPGDLIGIYPGRHLSRFFSMRVLLQSLQATVAPAVHIDLKEELLDVPRD